MTAKRLALLLVLIVPFCLGWTLARVPQDTISLQELPFSPARQAGQTLYVSGNLARKPDGTVVRDSVAAETRQTMENIGQVLKDNGYSFDDVANVTVYLRDLKDYAEMNKEYATVFKNGFPARATIGGVEIVFDCRVEISCIAHKKKP